MKNEARSMLDGSQREGYYKHYSISIGGARKKKEVQSACACRKRSKVKFGKWASFRCAFVFSFARPRPFAALSFFHLPDPGLSLRFRFFICQTHPFRCAFVFSFARPIPFAALSFFHLPDPPPFAALSFLLFWSNSTTSMFNVQCSNV